MTAPPNIKEDAIAYLGEKLRTGEFRHPHQFEVTPTKDGIDIYLSMTAETGQAWEVTKRVEEKDWQTNKRLDELVTVLKNAHLQSPSKLDEPKA